MSEWSLNQVNRIVFVMVDAANTEVPGLGGTFTLEISKDGGAFVPSAGTKAEIGSGWYSYLSTAGEADTPGPLAVRVNGAGCIQQNLAYEVLVLSSGAISFTYTVTNSVTLLPIAGVEIWFYTDIGMTNPVWYGVTDVFGVARDANGLLPWLTPGTYYIKRVAVNFTGVNPDVEVVS